MRAWLGFGPIVSIGEIGVGKMTASIVSETSSGGWADVGTVEGVSTEGAREALIDNLVTDPA